MRTTTLVIVVALAVLGTVIFMTVYSRVRHSWTHPSTERQNGNLLDYSVDINGQQTNADAKLGHGFQWVQADATIYVDLSLDDPNTAIFLEFLFFTQSKRIQITCPKHELMGFPHASSSWHVCTAEPYNLVQPCLVYSIGMSDESKWGFDRTVTTKYGCTEMAYDPTIGKETQKINDLMWFFNVGLGGQNGIVDNKQMKTLETMLIDNNHTETTIDILKIDIECSEWTSFDAILASPRCLSNVKQLMVEFHQCGFMLKEGKTPTELLGYWRTLRAIDELGFKLWRIWNNNFCWFRSRRLNGASFFGCFNAYYLNVKYML